jgi:hypothetical protein
MSLLSGSTLRATTLATIFEAYRPVEQYLQHVEIDREYLQASMTPLDAFLMRQVAAYYPKPPVVVDLAAGATHGASVVFWATQPHVLAVIASGASSDATCDWQSQVREVLRETHDDRKQIVFAGREHTEPATWKELLSPANQHAPLLVTLNVTQSGIAQIPSRLNEIFDQEPDASVFVFPLGPIGTCAALAQLIAFCGPDTPYSIIATREISPFLATSRLGIIGKVGHSYLPPILQRLRQLFEGNFQFLSMVNTVIDVTAREKDYEVQLRTHMDTLNTHMDTLKRKEDHILWLDSRLKYLEEEYVPWKNEYIENLETHLRNLSGSKALKLSNALRRVIARVR